MENKNEAQYDEIQRYRDLGWAIVSVDYSIPTMKAQTTWTYSKFVTYYYCTAACWPTQGDELKSAISFVRSNAGNYSIPSGPVVTLGFNSGGQLSEWANVDDAPVLRPMVRSVSPAQHIFRASR